MTVVMAVLAGEMVLAGSSHWRTAMLPKPMCQSSMTSMAT